MANSSEVSAQIEKLNNLIKTLTERVNAVSNERATNRPANPVGGQGRRPAVEPRHRHQAADQGSEPDNERDLLKLHHWRRTKAVNAIRLLASQLKARYLTEIERFSHTSVNDELPTPHTAMFDRGVELLCEFFTE